MSDERSDREEVRYDDLTSAREAARILRVSESTVWRWINRGVLQSYRVGPKRIYVRSSDLARQVKPGRAEPTLEALRSKLRLVPMAPGRARKDAVARAAAFRAEMLAKRGGVPFPPAWIDINEMREERSRELE
jgi:excisionase family DNA binding protein